jgi:AraC family transcriptional regulator, regulatory protein of adaptative response / methylated-DNA-[protein]-cysteine methyltransferase
MIFTEDKAMSSEHQEAAMPGLRAMRKALATRDRRFDGRFVYGVVTTGVFCRPSCASRAAKPENVRFFATPAQAQEAGLRPCKRCDPTANNSRSSQRIQSMAKYIEQHADEPWSLENLARQAHWSPAHLQRTFKAALGISPKAYHDAARLRLLKSGLKAGKSVLEAIGGAGFQSTSRVYARGTRNLGMTPSAYRAGGAGETISHAFRNTALGPLLMAATDRGVCFAQFGSGEAALVTQLQAEFPKAALLASSSTKSGALDDWMRAFEKHIAGRAPRPDLPLDMRGTAFQIRVWRFLLGVPEGDVMSYTEVASGIGEPAAVRAAASACARNRIAVLIPCHRVLRSDGGLGGYRWGLERKRLLIDAERRRNVA